MKRNYKIIAGLIVAGTLSGVALAQGGRGCDGMGAMGWQDGSMGGRRAAMKFDPAQRAERHLDMLKSELKITAAQEPLWQAFADRVKNEAGKGLQAMRAQAADEKLTAPERMAKMQASMQERLAAMTGVHENFNRLYEALTPEQKVIADRHAARMGNRSMGRLQRGAGRGAMSQG